MPLFNNAYNYTELNVCSIGEYPLGCLSSDVDDFECTRGSKARKMMIAFLIFVFTSNIIIVASVSILIIHIMSREGAENSVSTENGSDSSQSTKTWQGIWYIAAFMISWGPWYIWKLLRISFGYKGRILDLNTSALIYILALTQPTQGVWNALVFFRPQYLKYRERDPTEYRLASIFRVLGISVPQSLSMEWWKSLWSDAGGDINNHGTVKTIQESGLQ